MRTIPKDNDLFMFSKVMQYTKDARRQMSYAGIVFTQREDIEEFAECIYAVKDTSLYRSWRVDYTIEYTKEGYLAIRYRDYSSPLVEVTLGRIMNNVLVLWKRGKPSLYGSYWR